MARVAARFVLASFGVLMLLHTVAAADDKPAETRRTISVMGQGEVSATPDLAVLAIAVETTGATAGAAVAENATRTAAVVAAVKRMLGKEDKLTTTRYALEPRYQPGKPGEAAEPRIIGYIARNEVQLETHKVDDIGQLIDAANAAGANRINGLQFTLSNRNEQLRAALEKAGSEARAQAESVASALGVKLKQVVSATTATVPIAQPRHFEAMGMSAAVRAPTTVEPGAVTVSATLQVTYEIE